MPRSDTAHDPDSAAAEREFMLCLTPAKGSQFVHARDHDGVDFVLARPDGSIAQVIELKAHVNAVRDLDAAVAQLARYIDRASNLDHAWLLVRHTKLRPTRLAEEWGGLMKVLRPVLARKLALVALTGSEAWTSTPLPSEGPIAKWVHACTGRDRDLPEPERTLRVQPAVPTAKFFDIWKVLLSAWLQNEAPLPIHTVEERSGASHPTVAEAIKRLEQRGEVRRTQDRRVELRAWPRKSYAELEPLLSPLRRTVWFTDRSGRQTEPEALVRRIGKVAPATVALGGVEAARELDPAFDLLGVPRVDLTIHVPQGRPDLGFVQQADRALARSDNESGAVLAIHCLTRRDSLFRLRKGLLPIVDPAEVVLDLAELRLTSQLEELVGALRGGKS